MNAKIVVSLLAGFVIGYKVGHKKVYSKPKLKEVGYEFDEPVFDTRKEAEEVLEKMHEHIDTYGLVSVVDFKDMCALSSQFKDTKHGWIDLKNVSVKKCPIGYKINLPKAIILKNEGAN